MLRNISGLAKRLLLAVALAVGMFTAAALQRTSANVPAPDGSDFTCTNINVDGKFTGNIFCTSSTSSAGFYYYYYNVYTGVYTIGP
jgi:predicted alpha/beta hydrolase